MIRSIRNKRLLRALLTSVFILHLTILSSSQRRVLLANLSSENLSSHHLRISEHDKSSNKGKGKSRIRQISILGERNSGTTWIHKHLGDCFSDSIYVKEYLNRDKHWFQDSALTTKPIRYDTLVLAMFRNPYDWLKAMNLHPHHASAHLDLYWDEFLTKPWTMERIGLDLNASENTTCQEGFQYSQIVACVKEPIPREQYTHRIRHSEHKPIYEMKQDGSGEPFANILELRAAKIKNFLETKSYPQVRDVWTIQYESLLSNGTKFLLDKILYATGIPYNCDPFPPQNRTRREFSKRFEQYVDDHLDWITEKLIGYQKGYDLDKS